LETLRSAIRELNATVAIVGVIALAWTHAIDGATAAGILGGAVSSVLMVRALNGGVK
jgi:nucleotide-binding universal stress UspA family protein